MMIKRYRDLKHLRTLEERYNYLRIPGRVGSDTFGYDRYLNQLLYKSKRWLRTRDDVIVRDNACDLGIEGYEIHDKIIIHHMNPISIEDIELNRDHIFDPEFLITTTHNTHNAIHFGNESLLPRLPIVRTQNDTCPWR